MFNASIYVEIGNGQRALFWTDRWLQGQSVEDIAPCLFNAVHTRAKQSRTVAQGLHEDRWVQDISGALIVQVLLEYLRIWDLTRVVHLDINWSDHVCLMWTPDKIRSLLLHPRTDSSSWVSTQLREQKSSTKHGLQASASSSCGWYYMIDAGLLIVANNMVYRMMTCVSYAPSCRRPLITCLWVVPFHGRFGLGCYGG